MGKLRSTNCRNAVPSIDVMDHAYTVARIREGIVQLQQEQTAAIEKAMEHGMSPLEYEDFVTRRNKLARLKRTVATFEKEMKKSTQQDPG
jgi:formate dehydrogenase maturation protein FdhE